MIVKITAKRQVTFPAGPGDSLELEKGPDGFILRPRRIDYSRLGTLKVPRVIRPSTSESSENRDMTQRYGTDTSILVRLVTREPEAKGGSGHQGSGL